MTALFGDKTRGLTFVVSAPAGTGKTTLVKKLIGEFPNVVASISYTTREARKLEENKDEITVLLALKNLTSE